MRWPRCRAPRAGRPGWLATTPDDLAVEPGQGHDDVGRPVLVDLQVLALVDELLDHLVHVVGAGCRRPGTHVQQASSARESATRVH